MLEMGMSLIAVNIASMWLLFSSLGGGENRD